MLRRRTKYTSTGTREFREEGERTGPSTVLQAEEPVFKATNFQFKQDLPAQTERTFKASKSRT